MQSEADILKIAALIINKKGEILLGRKKGKEVWINIGGRIEGDESPIQCLKREIKEELDVEIQVHDKQGPFAETPLTPALDDADKTVKIIWYMVTLVGEPKPSNEIEEIRWVNPISPDVELSSQIKEYLLPKLAKSLYCC